VIGSGVQTINITLGDGQAFVSNGDLEIAADSVVTVQLGDVVPLAVNGSVIVGGTFVLTNVSGLQTFVPLITSTTGINVTAKTTITSDNCAYSATPEVRGTTFGALVTPQSSGCGKSHKNNAHVNAIIIGTACAVGFVCCVTLVAISPAVFCWRRARWWVRASEKD